MGTMIREKMNVSEQLPDVLREVLPPSLCFALSSLTRDGVAIDEVRIRTGRRVSVTSCGKNILLDTVLLREDVDAIVSDICEGSLYAHADTIKQGYVTVAGGVRVGIVGRAAIEDGRVIGVYDVSALCFRLPRNVLRVGAPVVRLVRELRADGGVLIYSPPAEGKTTLLRSVIRQLSSGDAPMRVAVIDTRGELGVMLTQSDLCVDVMSGYPKALGIEIGARSMNAQMIACDEIGEVGEVASIIAAQNCGVPLLATAHASSLCGLLRRTGIAMLHKACVFGAYVGIRRVAGGRDYTYTITKYEDADAYLQNFGSGDSRA